jgi:chemotaxis protein CheC
MGIIFKDLTDVQLDALKEVTHIGAASAVTALSQFINKTVTMSPPVIVRVNFACVPELSSQEAPRNTVVFLEISGNIPGKIFIAIDGKSIVFFTVLLLGKGVPSEALSEMDISAIKEVATVMSGSHLKSLGEIVNTVFYMDPPSFEYSGSENLLKVVSSQCLDKGDEPICFRSDFFASHGKEKLNGSILFMLNGTSLRTLAQAVSPSV